MKKTKAKNRGKSIRSILLIGVLAGIGIAVYLSKPFRVESDAYQPIPLATHSNGKNFVGSESCMDCHADVYASHSKTAHYRSSALADSSSVKGSLKKGKNTYRLSDSILLKMTSLNADVFQEVHSLKTDEPISRLKVDMVIGSGTKGQSYLTWDGDELYQLPISYFTPSDSWTMSPGMDFSPESPLRPVNARCLECHTTFAKNTALYGMGNEYDRERIIYGIDCERCHGPSGEHAVFHRNNPKVSEPKFIVNHDTLSRQQRLDACALCHSGVRSNSKPAFHFLTGDNLMEHSLPDTTTPIEEVDVHGNQYALLKASQCFRQTATMDCSTCHDPHSNQRGDTAYFNSKCFQCHQKNTVACKEDATVMAQFGDNCISCHMPLRPSSSMFVQQNGDSVKTAVEVRTHWIAVYPEIR